MSCDAVPSNRSLPCPLCGIAGRRHGIRFNKQQQELATMSDKFFGIWLGPAHAVHGISRAHQSRIAISSGSEIWTSETHDYKVGTRVEYRTGFEQPHGHELLAFEVKSAEPVTASLEDIATKVTPEPKAAPTRAKR
jgi:hypothetical protein